MQTLMMKYKDAFQKAPGSQVEKVKYVIMHHVGNWEWEASDSLVADLIDDLSITAEDILELLQNVYVYEGGNEEFRYAVKAMKVALQKEKLQEAKTQVTEDLSQGEIYEEEAFDGSAYFMPQFNDFLSKEQSLSH